MTIAIALKVGDGLVFGADSAATLSDGKGTVINAYYNAEKVFNLVKGLPVGGVFYGLAGLDNRSVTSLVKDLRMSLTVPGSPGQIDLTAYTISDLAAKVRAFFYETRYCRTFGIPTGGAPPVLPPGMSYPVMGFLIGGYSYNEEQAEVWHVEVAPDGNCPPPQQVIRCEDTWGVYPAGMPEAVTRILRGWSPQLPGALLAQGVPEPTVRQLFGNLQPDPLVQAEMPLQDAINLVEFLIRTTIGFERFRSPTPGVAEPIDLACISRHEHFRWVKRKHYFSADLNPSHTP